MQGMAHAAFWLWLAASLIAQQKPSLLAVFAHPDDETIVGALLAKYAREGHPVYLVTATDGQQGTTPHGGLPAGEELGRARRLELKCSIEKLGLTGWTPLGFWDAKLSEPKTLEQIGRRVVDEINRLRPDVLLTWGPDGVTGHPDHRAVSNVTTQVFQQRRLLRHHPRKLYYVALSDRQFAQARMEDRPVPFRTLEDSFITTWIDCKKYASAAFESIQCHETQWDGKRMEWHRNMFEQIMEGMITLRLAMSDLPATQRKETDIFAGLR